MHKIQSKKGASGIIITLCIVIVACIAIIPAEISNSTTHITSKKLKTHINAIANSDCLIIPTVSENGGYIEEPEKGALATKTFFETLFKCSFAENEKKITSDHYSVTYESVNKKIAFQYDFYSKSTSETKKPTNIMGAITTNSKGENLNVSSIIDSVSSKKPTVIITVRYDTKDFLGNTESMIRYGSSQINFVK